MMMNIKVRELIPQKSKNDFDLMFPVLDRIWNNPDNLKYLSLSLESFDENMIRQWLSNHLDNGIRYYGAIGDDDEIKGISVILENGKEKYEIFGMGVLEEMKGRGVGKKLVQHAIDIAQKKKNQSVQVSVFVDNKVMLGLLISMDFIPFEMQHDCRVDGMDIIKLKKRLL